MAKQLKLRRGTTSQHSSFTGAEGEVTVDTTKDTLVVHDGSTAGGTPLAKESDIPSGYTHPNHSGEVTSTGDGATVIADNIVDEANLKVSNSPTNGQFLSAQSGNTGGLTWADASASPDGSSTTVQFNDNGSFGGEWALRFNKTTQKLYATYFEGDGSSLTNLPTGLVKSFGTNIHGGENYGFSGYNLASGADRNTLIGNLAGYELTTGDHNTFIGSEAGYKYTTSNMSTAIGYKALYNTTGGANTAIGPEAIMGASSGATGTDNTAVGYMSMRSLTSGTYNSALGESSLFQVTSGQHNVGIGYYAGFNITSGNNNIAIGQQSLDALTSGSHSIAIGSNAGGSSVTGQNNIFLGSYCGATLGGSAGYNVLIGPQSIYGGGTAAASRTATGNSCLGWQNFFEMTTGNYNTAVGYESSRLVSTGSYNVTVGYQSYRDGVNTGSRNIAIGPWCMKEGTVTGADNVAMGNGALKKCTSGENNVAIGTVAGENSTTASNNTLVGRYAGNDITTGGANACFGHFAGQKITTTEKNTCLGGQAGMEITTGANNTCVGYNAGYTGTNDLTTGDNNVIVGYQTSPSSSTVNNEITLGNTSSSTLRCNTQTISSLSDRRDKTDINTLDLGLSFINALNPVKFKWETRDGNGKDGTYEAGFIAQDFQQIQKDNDADYLGLVMDENPDRLEASYGKLVPMLVQAVKELSAKVKALEAK